MAPKNSSRLSAIIDALPLKQGQRVLEIGCGTGVAAREIVRRFPDIFLLGIDRSAKAIAQATTGSQMEIQNGQLQFWQCSVETFVLPDLEKKFDLAFAIRVGALDGRHPELEAESLQRIRRALTKNGKLFVAGGNLIQEIKLYQ